MSETLPQKLMKLAREAATKSYSPYSKFRVGAALLSERGQYFCAANVENASFGLTCCAERNAIFKAISEEGPEMKIQAIAAYTLDGVGSPCGACRQVIAEFGKDCAVYFKSEKSPIVESTIRDLLSYAFEM